MIKHWNIYFIQFVILCIRRFYFLSDLDQNIDSFPLLIWIKLLVTYFPSNRNLIVKNIQISRIDPETFRFSKINSFLVGCKNSFSNTIRVKSVISRDFQRKDDNARFTRVPLKPYSAGKNMEINIVWKVFISLNFSIVSCK